MPKKTRKEKIIAQLRRKLETTETKDQTWEVDTFQLPNIPLQNPTSHIPPLSSLSYIIKDLRKTFFLAGLAISLEFIVYWLWYRP